MIDMKNIYQKTFQHSQSLWVNYHCEWRTHSNAYFESHLWINHQGLSSSKERYTKIPLRNSEAISLSLFWLKTLKWLMEVYDIDSMSGFIEKVYSGNCTYRHYWEYTRQMQVVLNNWEIHQNILNILHHYEWIIIENEKHVVILTLNPINHQG